MYFDTRPKARQDRPVVLHRGVFKPTATLSEAFFLITGMTIGAGILGIPYVVAEAGVPIGVLLLIFLGIVILFLNLMIGEVAFVSGENLQLPGLAGRYVGRWAKTLLSATIIFSIYGALLAYLVGEGSSLSALLGGNRLVWSVIFWSVGSFVIWRGLSTVKVFEKFLGSLVIALIVVISLYALPHVEVSHLTYYHVGKFFVPFGVLLFALHGTPAIAEAHALLPGNRPLFHRAVIIGTLVPVAVYVLFAVAVVGVTGIKTAPIATLGLAQSLGPVIGVLGNLFAILAMGTSFIGLGTAFRDMLSWDYHVPAWWAAALVFSVPLALLLIGVTNFVAILNVVGGLFLAIEAFVTVLIYWRVRQRHPELSGHFSLRYPTAMEALVLLVFTTAALTSIMKLLF